ncbi:MAG: serine/threonine-protein kinase [Kofleriaceae bacterium]
MGALLGRGGMGQVHIARHKSGRLVAIKRVRKTLSHDQLVTDRLTDEAKMLRRVQHPNVVRALDDGRSADGQPFLVMDRAHGTPLDQIIAKLGPLPQSRIAAIATQLLAGLGAIHAAGVVHADVKSSNVMVDDIDHVTIIDFGLARTVTRSHLNGLIAGTPAYMAPEIIAGEAPSIASDIYGAGAIIYELLTGTPPYSGQLPTILARQLTEAIDPPSQRAPKRGISAELDQVVLRALDKTPAARYPNVRELCSALEEALYRDPGLPTLVDLLEITATRDFWGGCTVAAPAKPVTGEPTRVIQSPSTIIAETLSTVRDLMGKHDLLGAIRELERSLTTLPPNIVTGEIDPDVWRIESVLAALYDHSGRCEGARRMARVAFQHALRSGSESAQLRTRELLTRLSSRPGGRIARGSAQISAVDSSKRR